MEVSAKVFERTVILNVTGPVSGPDAQLLATEIPLQCTNANTVILVMSDIEIEPDTGEAILSLREEIKKPKILIASTAIPGANAKDMMAALDLLSGGEVDRIVHIFQKGHELERLKAKLAEIDRGLSELLLLTGSATKEDVAEAELKFKDHNRKLKFLAKTLGGEIDALKKQRKSTQSVTADPAVKKRIEQVRKQAMASLKALNVID